MFRQVVEMLFSYSFCGGCVIFAMGNVMFCPMRFREQEIRALALLLPTLIAVVVVVVVFRGSVSRGAVADRSADAVCVSAADSLFLYEAADESDPVAVELSPFDPNTADYDRLRRLGIDRRTAVNIIRYRTAGKVFRIPEDLALCYGMTDSLFALLRPYVRIGGEYALLSQMTEEQPADRRAEDDAAPEERSEISTPSAPFNPNEVDGEFFVRLGFSERQARTIINYRESCGGFRDADHFGRCYAVSEQALERLRDWLVFDSATSEEGEDVRAEMEDGEERACNETSVRVELNGADSVTLVGLNGIGPWSASEILKYRERLGGYAYAEQLLDLRAVTMENYERICEQIWIDSCKIKKIDINFAGPKSMAEHPYMTPMRVRKIVKQRKLKGGWSTIEEMTEENILTEDEARRLAPYLQFVQR